MKQHFIEGKMRVLAPMPSAEIIDDISDGTKWTGGPLNAHDRHWVQVGARHGFVAGWYAGVKDAGFFEASGIETEGQDGETRLGAEHESPTAEGGDAIPSGPLNHPIKE